MRIHYKIIQKKTNWKIGCGLLSFLLIPQTNYLVLTKKKPNFCFNIKRGNSIIEQKSHVKYLNVIDDKLN